MTDQPDQDRGEGGRTSRVGQGIPEAKAPAKQQLNRLTHKIDLLKDMSQQLAKKLSPILPTEKAPMEDDSKKSAGIAGSSPFTTDLRKLSVSVGRITKTLRSLVRNTEV